mgnify:CR=1 FL=1
MALQIEKPGKRTEYILQADRESSSPTKFMLRSLTWEQMGEIGELALLSFEQAMKIAAIVQPSREEKRTLTSEEIQRVNDIAPMDAKSAARLTQQHAIAVRYGVAEISGLLDEEGQPYALSAAELARIAPSEVLHELGTQIMEISRYSGSAIKK